jgi:hypothetical protein
LSGDGSLDFVTLLVVEAFAKGNMLTGWANQLVFLATSGVVESVDGFFIDLPIIPSFLVKTCILNITDLNRSSIMPRIR